MEHEKLKWWSITDKLEDWKDYVWAFLISAVIYVFVWRYQEEWDSLWLPFLLGLVTIYAFKSATRKLIPDLSAKFNIILEVVIYIAAVLIFQIF